MFFFFFLSLDGENIYIYIYIYAHIYFIYSKYICKLLILVGFNTNEHMLLLIPIHLIVTCSAACIHPFLRKDLQKRKELNSNLLEKTE